LFEEYLKARSSGSAKLLTSGLIQAMREFSAADDLETDLTFAVISDSSACYQ
jgi:hypothetical protein